MFTLQRTLSSSVSLMSQMRLLSAQEQRCLVLLLQQTCSSPQNPRFQSSASATAAQAYKAQAANKSKVISTSAGTQAAGAKGRTLPPYMVFRYCQPASIGQHQSTATHSTMAYDMTSADLYGAQPIDATATRPLVLLFGWMLSKNSHLEKYRDFWTRRGYDILTVQTSPFDLLLPSVGGKKVASNVFNFLTNVTPRYDQILVHAFSVGGYQLGELLQRLYEGVDRGEPEAERLFASFKGWLIDSVVFAEDAAPGLSRAVTLNPVVQPILEKSIATFLSTTKRYTFDRYKVVESNIIDNKRRVPTMLMFSKDDVVSNYRSNFACVDSWEKKGILSRAKCWDKSAHVLHYKEHPEDYEATVDDFISKLNITKAPLPRNF